MSATIYYAKWILLPDFSILTNGAITVNMGIITHIGSRSSVKKNPHDRFVNLGNRLLMPGLINSHTHLEESIIRGYNRVENEPFTVWETKKKTKLKQVDKDRQLSTIRLAIKESLANGITTIVDSSQTETASLAFKDEFVRSWIFHETHFDHDISKSDFSEHIQTRIKASAQKYNFGLSPFSLYSLVPEIHKVLTALVRENGYLWAMHCAESAEELQAFSQMKGDLFFRITKNHKWSYGETRRGAMYYALTENIIPPNATLFHCNYVNCEELSLLQHKRSSIVICPQYTKNMGHKHFPLEVALNRGINICLGTESPNTLDRINLFDELFSLKQDYPHLSAINLLKFVTINGAKALGCEDKLGSLDIGKYADIIGIPFNFEPKKNFLEGLIEEEPEIDIVIVNGEEIIMAI